MLGTTILTSITSETKISPAFAPFLAETGPNDIRDAIVIFRSPESEERVVRGRMRAFRSKLKDVEMNTKAQLAIERDVLASYKKAGGKSFPHKREPNVSTIGSSTLPFLSVEITPNTLPILADNPNVVAILPNQKINLIDPKSVEYRALLRQEEKDELTWGLKHLGIPDLWETTQGKDINVAVLDTGVHAAHPALAGRVADFIVIDSLGRR